MPESRPTVKIFEPEAGKVLSPAGPIVLRGWAQDPVDGVIPEKLTWQVDGSTVGQGSPVSAGNLRLGQHSITASAQNSQGLVTSITESVSISAQAPRATIYTPADQSSFGTDQAIVFRGGATDVQQGDLPASALSWSIDGVHLGDGPNFTAKIAAVGDRAIQLAATNTSGLSTSTTVTVHIGAPAGKPSVEVTQPINNAAFAARNPDGSLANHSQLITFTAQATDSSGAVIPATILWTSDIDGVLGTGPSITHSLRGGPCGITLHKITVTVTDHSGRSVTDTIVVSVGQIC
jgi:hypothetical protein